jgi:hypothetical protein
MLKKETKAWNRSSIKEKRKKKKEKKESEKVVVFRHASKFGRNVLNLTQMIWSVIEVTSKNSGLVRLVSSGNQPSTRGWSLAWMYLRDKKKQLPPFFPPSDSSTCIMQSQWVLVYTVLRLENLETRCTVQGGSILHMTAIQGGQIYVPLLDMQLESSDCQRFPKHWHRSHPIPSDSSCIHHTNLTVYEKISITRPTAKSSKTTMFHRTATCP